MSVQSWAKRHVRCALRTPGRLALVSYNLSEQAVYKIPQHVNAAKRRVEKTWDTTHDQLRLTSYARAKLPR